jgi:hypothetical protein
VAVRIDENKDIASRLVREAADRSEVHAAARKLFQRGVAGFIRPDDADQSHLGTEGGGGNRRGRTLSPQVGLEGLRSDRLGFRRDPVDQRRGIAID